MKPVSSVLICLSSAGNLTIYCIANSLFRKVIKYKVKKVFTTICPFLKSFTRTR